MTISCELGSHNGIKAVISDWSGTVSDDRIPVYFASVAGIVGLQTRYFNELLQEERVKSGRFFVPQEREDELWNSVNQKHPGLTHYRGWKEWCEASPEKPSEFYTNTVLQGNVKNDTDGAFVGSLYPRTFEAVTRAPLNRGDVSAYGNDSWYAIEPVLRPEAQEAFTILKNAGLQLGILSTHPKNAVRNEVSKFDPEGKLFDENFVWGKPESGAEKSFTKRERLLSMVDEMGVEPAEAVYLGDIMFDAQASRLAGMHQAGILGGYHSEAQLGGEVEGGGLGGPAKRPDGYQTPCLGLFPELTDFSSLKIFSREVA